MYLAYFSVPVCKGMLRDKRNCYCGKIDSNNKGRWMCMVQFYTYTKKKLSKEMLTCFLTLSIFFVKLTHASLFITLYVKFLNTDVSGA